MLAVAADAAAPSDSATAASRGKTYRWTLVNAKAAFAPRDGAGALVFQDKMWLLGGWNPSDKVHFPTKCNSEVWSSTDGVTWTLQVAKAPWEERHTAGYVVHQGKMWIVGGDPLQGHYQPNVWCSADGMTWEQVTDKAPWGTRCLHHTVVHDGKIWVMGGQTTPQFAPAAESFYNDVWCSEDGVRWTQVTAHAPWAERGMIGGAAVMNGRIWILGGGTYETPEHPLPRKFYNDVWSSADGVDWQRHTEAAPWHARQYHDVAVFDNHLWVMEGGFFTDAKDARRFNQNDVWYSADGANWRELPDTPWPPRHAASVFVYHGSLWMVAGNNMQSDVWRLDVVETAAAQK
jgi:N-acetylneuraminic acid mutarotase